MNDGQGTRNLCIPGLSNDPVEIEEIAKRTGPKANILRVRTKVVL